VGAHHTVGGAQPLPTGNGVLDPRLNGVPSAAEIIGDRNSVSSHVNAGEEANRVPPATAPAKPEDQSAPRATPGALRPIAPKPQSSSKDANAAAQTTNKGSTQPTRSILPVKKRAVRAKKTDTETTTSKAKQKAVRTQIHTDTLLVPTLADAQRVIVKYTVLNIVNDDHAEVAANYQTWIKRITKPFDADFRAEPEVTVILAEHEAADNDSAAQYVQGCAWILFQKILDTHTKGSMEHVPSTIVTGGENTTMKCSARMGAAIKALEEYPIVRYDLLKRERLAAIVASPQGFYRKKVDNLFVNYKKRGNAGEVRVKNQDANETPVASGKPKATRKRKAPSPDLGDDENDESPDGGDEVQPTKRINTGSKRVDSAHFWQ
jgi:hypothetical protein